MHRDLSHRRAAFRRDLDAGECFAAPGAHNALIARIAQLAGFKSIYMSGAGISNTLLGVPDIGVVGLTEMSLMARYISNAVDLPLIADADTGYGNALGVIRTVREYEMSGVSALHVEDQTSPKRCGNVAGKELTSTEEMQGKIRAACDARSDPNLLIIGRTDAVSVAGFEEAVNRGIAWHKAGADVVYGEGLRTVDELREFARRVPGLKLLNMGGYGETWTTPKLPLSEVRELGYSIVTFPLAVTRATNQAAWDFLHGLFDRGHEFEIEHIDGLTNHPVKNWYQFIGMDGVRRQEELYLPADISRKRYHQGDGYVPAGAEG